VNKVLAVPSVPREQPELAVPPDKLPEERLVQPALWALPALKVQMVRRGRKVRALPVRTALSAELVPQALKV
jgi:hypothetical protein